jgi:diguanylate cyclase (GGDEF)-like protein
MTTKRINISSIINITLLVFYIFTILFFTLTDDSSGMGLNRNNIETFNDDWTISYNNKIEKTTILPINYHLKPGSTYSIERTINRKDFIYPILRIRSSMMDVHAYIDNQLIHSFDATTNDTDFHEPYPASWQLIEIPIADSIGKTLKITFSSPTTQFSGLINSIMIGKGEAIILDLIQHNFIILIISIFLILLSIFALVTVFWTNKLGITKHIIYLAFFGIASGFWIISESTILQLLIPNRFLISSTSYIINLLLPLIIALFFRDVVLEGFKKLITIIAKSIMCLSVCEIILQLTGTVSLITSTLFSIIMIIILSVILIYCLINEGYKKDNPRARHYLFIFLALFIFASIIMGLFISGVYQNLGKYLTFGVFGFYILLMSDAIKSIHDLMETKNKAFFYKQLAYEDYLTKGWNRTAFEQDIEKLTNQGISFRLVLLDLNHLKQINDTYGHVEGDYTIIESYNSIKEPIKDKGKSYRISGDEFACIIYDTSNEIFEKYKNQVNLTLKEKAKNKPYEPVLAFGTKIYYECENFTDFYKKVDIEMYKHKKMLKTRDSAHT